MAIRLLWGYHIPKGSNHPICLLVDKDDHRPYLKVINSRAKYNSKTFRQHFAHDDPPFPFTWVTENIITEEILALDEDHPIPDPVEGLTHGWKTTRLSEACITDSIFVDTDPLRKAKNSDLNLWSQVSERDFVMNCIFKPSFLRQIRVNLIKLLDLKQTVIHVLKSDRVSSTRKVIMYIPQSLKHLFIHFDPIDPAGSVDQYEFGADHIAMRHKIVKHVLEDLCPFIRVAIGDTLNLEMCLSMCLPTGSAGRGCEIFSPRRDAATRETYYVAGPSLVYRESDFTRVDCMSACTIDENECALVEPLPDGVSYFDWSQYDVEAGSVEMMSSDTDKPADFFHDEVGQIALIASTYSVGETDTFFKNGAVVFTNHETSNPLQPFACVDLSNYYATVVNFFNLDPYVAKIMMKMTSLRHKEPDLKKWIVSILGKSQFLDPRLYRRMKDLSVATMLSIINENQNVVMGATTDGVLVDATKLPYSVAVPRGFLVKTEFIPNIDRPMVTINPKLYVGISREGNVHHRGFIGKDGQPTFYRDVISTVLESCLEAAYGDGNYPIRELVSDTVKSITDILSTIDIKGYMLPDPPSPVKCTGASKYRVIDYLINDMSVEYNQFFAVVDDHIVPSSYLNTPHTLPTTLSGYCIKQFNIPMYVTIMRSRLMSVARAFDYHPGCSRVCQEVFKVFKTHIHSTLPADRTSYPGGVGVVR